MDGKRRHGGRLGSVKLYVAGFAAFLALGAPARPALADEAASPNREETVSLQRRLTDAGCYSGAIDGALSAALDAAIKACPDQQPVLRIETGMHTGAIWRGGVDAACTRYATPSDDKTVRVWSLPDGRLERTIRLPIDMANGGKLNAVAMSPDGRQLAAGGWDASYEKTETTSLTLIDQLTGGIRRYGRWENVINALGFSPDGRRVAVGLGHNEGLRVLDVASGVETFADRDYGDTILSVVFAADGSLFTASDDGLVRRYGPDLRLTAKRAEPGGMDPITVAIDPAGKRLAVGFDDAPRVSIVDAVTLAPIAGADTGDLKSDTLSHLAWSSDGATLVAAGRASEIFNGEWRAFARRFTRDGRRLGTDIPVANSSIRDLQRCGAGFVFAASDPAVGRLTISGVATTLQGARTADMRGKRGDAFALSGDAATVRFGLGYGDAKPILFDLLGASLGDSAARPAGMAVPIVDGLPVTDWKDDDFPKFRGKTIPLEHYETSRALALRPDRQGFALGTEYWVRTFDAAGKERWKRPVPGIAWGVDFNADGEIVAVAFYDGTIRWLRWSDGQELLALFVDAPTRKWVAWTPTGYYMASPGAEELIGWHVNRGWAQQADFFPAARFSARFNRPDIVQLVLKTRDEAAAVREANGKAGRRADVTPLSAQLPPVVAIALPAQGGKFSGDSVEVTFNVRSPSGLPIDGVQALIDGRPVETRGIAPAASQGEGPAGETRHLTIPAPAHDFELALIARSGALIGEAAKLRLVYAGAPPIEQVLKPKLYVVTIGVSDYADPDMRLGYAADDARGFAETLQKQQGGLYSEVKVLPPLLDRAVTRTSVISALRWLRKQVTERDIGMVLIAGHGATDDGQNYWFLPSDATRDNIDSNGVSQDDLLRELRQVAGKTILFLDTCHANQAMAAGPARRGLVDIDGVINEFTKAENGLVVFSSSRGRETSQESAAWGHGAFTEALIEGLGGKADLQHNGAITVSELDAYVAERVKQLTSGDQHPVMTRPTTMHDFAFAVTR